MYNDGSNWVIAKESTKYCGYVFLVDRRRFKKKWWTSKLSEAMRFTSEFAAVTQCSKLKYGKPEVYLASEFWRQ